MHRNGYGSKIWSAAYSSMSLRRRWSIDRLRSFRSRLNLPLNSNSQQEDLYSKCTNEVLHEYGKPDLPWSIKAHLQGRPVPEAHAMLCDWAKLPISDDEFLDKIRALQARYFPTTQLLPGVEDMLQRLRKTGVQMALATSSMLTF